MKRSRSRFPGVFFTILDAALAGVLAGCGTSTTDYQEFSAQEADSAAENPAETDSEAGVSSGGDADAAPTTFAEVSPEESAESEIETFGSPKVVTADSPQSQDRSREGTPQEKSGPSAAVSQEAAANSVVTGAEASATEALDPSEAVVSVDATNSDPGTKATRSTKPRKVEVLIKDREFRTEGPEGALRISYDDFDLLKVLNMDPVTPDAPNLMPDWLKHLDGKRVRVRGFMYPPFQETGIRAFILARDNQICCFGRNPKIYDLVEVRLRDGVTTKYIQNRPFDVVGTFRIDASAEDDELYELYKMDDAIVIDN